MNTFFLTMITVGSLVSVRPLLSSGPRGVDKWTRDADAMDVAAETLKQSMVTPDDAPEAADRATLDAAFAKQHAARPVTGRARKSSTRPSSSTSSSSTPSSSRSDLPNGESCDSDSECKSENCVDDVCVGEHSKDYARGASCDDDSDCASNDCFSHQCE